jgi:hypothetical protein
MKQLAPQIDKRPQLGIGLHRDHQPVRLMGDKGGQSEQILALPGERLRNLVLGPAPVDLSFEIEWPAELPVRPSVSRNTHSSGVSGSTSTFWGCPLMERRGILSSSIGLPDSPGSRMSTLIIGGFGAPPHAPLR